MLGDLVRREFFWVVVAVIAVAAASELVRLRQLHGSVRGAPRESLWGAFGIGWFAFWMIAGNAEMHKALYLGYKGFYLFYGALALVSCIPIFWKCYRYARAESADLVILGGCFVEALVHALVGAVIIVGANSWTVYPWIEPARTAYAVAIDLINMTYLIFFGRFIALRGLIWKHQS